MARSPSPAPRPKPFLKWVGGKRQLLDQLLKRLPPEFDRYYEPFLGGGALFFELAAQSRIRKALLSDLNGDLIGAYAAVRTRTGDLMAALKRHVYDADHYYRVRGQNPKPMNPVERAARLIFLNKTCYNGLYRVNSRGEFNVPFGRYKNPLICDEANLKACASALENAVLSHQSFAEAIQGAKAGDLVYFDPPYHPVSRTSNFSAYEKSGFGEAEHRRLRDAFGELDRKGCFVMLSNSSSPFTRKLFRDFRLETVRAARSVNSKSSARGRVPEILVTNFRSGRPQP